MSTEKNQLPFSQTASLTTASLEHVLKRLTLKQVYACMRVSKGWWYACCLVLRQWDSCILSKRPVYGRSWTDNDSNRIWPFVAAAGASTQTFPSCLRHLVHLQVLVCDDWQQKSAVTAVITQSSDSLQELAIHGLPLTDGKPLPKLRQLSLTLSDGFMTGVSDLSNMTLVSQFLESVGGRLQEISVTVTRFPSRADVTKAMTQLIRKNPRLHSFTLSYLTVTKEILERLAQLQHLASVHVLADDRLVTEDFVSLINGDCRQSLVSLTVAWYDRLVSLHCHEERSDDDFDVSIDMRLLQRHIERLARDAGRRVKDVNAANCSLHCQLTH